VHPRLDDRALRYLDVVVKVVDHLEAPVRVTADPATNALVVSATPQDWETLRAVIATLDVPRRQVFVEAIIVEATVDRTRALGFEFRATTDLGSYGGLAQGNLSALASAAWRLGSS